jgi:hypothetical protein
MKAIVANILCCAIVTFLAGGAIASPTSRVTVKVVDEHSQPLNNADVEVWYHVGNKQTANKGKSNDKGEYVSTGEGMLPQVTINSRSQGYYESCVIYKFDKKSMFNRWEPWNPTVEVVLKKKRNPVAMVVNGGIIKLPKLDSPVGYDLEKGDWVAPYGVGAVNDFIFTFHAVSRAYTDYECNFTLTFSNEDDGIQEYYFGEKDQSSYRWPFLAPESGYASKLYREKSDSPQSNLKSNEKKKASYIYRVRTQKDKDGKIVGAIYGKIRKEFEFGPNGTILFGYFLNPDGTRNLEEDPKKNLFKK